MNSELNQKPTPKSPVRAFLRDLPRKAWRALAHNWPWKLLSLFLAVCLWAGLISQDPTLTRERVFADVPVTLTGAEQLQRSGYIVLNDFTEAPLSVRMRVDVPQRSYSSVQASNFSPRLDLSKITSTGTQTLRVQTTSTTTYGTVNEVTPAEVELQVDEYISSYRIPVTINRTGDWPQGFYGTTANVNPSTVTISGPRSLVEKVARVRVDFDVSQLPAYAGLVRTAVPFVLCNAAGEEIQSELLQLTSESVILRSILVEQTLYPTKLLQLSSLGLTTGESAEGYEIKSVTATPNAILAAGDETGLAALDTLFADRALDITGANATLTGEINLRRPSELAYLSTDTVTVTVEIGPVIAGRSFDRVKLTLRGGTAKTTVDPATVSVTLTGPQNALAALRASALEPYVDVSALEAGSYELPVALAISGTDSAEITYAITPATVRVTIGE